MADYYDMECAQKMPDQFRLGFVRKVYGILTAQLAITTLICALVVFSRDLQEFLFNNFWILWTCLGISFIVMIVLLCCRKYARQVPTNYILLGLFTFAEALIVAVICATYPMEIVMMAAVLTLGVTSGLTLYACFTKTDFTYCGAFMCLFVMIFIFFGISLFFLGSSQFAQIIYCILGITIYGIYLIIDTQMILGGKKYQFSEDDYIIGALTLYIDIIQMFLFILRLLGQAKR